MLEHSAITIELPPLSAPRARALDLLSAGDANVDELAMVVEADPALTAAVLRAANSALSAARDPIRSADDAIVRIGLEDTQRIVAGAVVGDTFDGVRHAGIDADAMWRHLVATGILADAACQSQRGQAGAFTAGLLHDVGRLAMAAYDPDRYGRVVEVARLGVDVVRSEFLLFGSDHMAWGEQLGREWQLSEDIVAAIAGHHNGEAEDVLVAAVATGRRVSWALGMGDGVTEPYSGPQEFDSADAELVERAGGATELLERIDWYCGAIQRSAR